MSTASPDRLFETYSRIASTNRAIFNTLHSVLTRFRQQGIDCILLKGADLIPRLYAALGMRPMVDVDLLVREQDLPTIDWIFKELGYYPQIDGNPAYVDPDFMVLFDLISTIWYADDLEEIWQRADRRMLDGIPVKGMGANDLLLYLTMYVVVHRGCLSPVFAQDLALLIDTETIDWPFILTEASRLNLKVPLYHGFAYASERANAKIPPEVMRQLTPSSLSEKVLQFFLQRLVTETRIDRVGFFLLFITQPGFQKLRWLKTSVFPPMAFLKYRYGSRAEANPFLLRVLRPWYLLFHAFLLSGRIVFALFKPYSSSAGPALRRQV